MYKTLLFAGLIAALACASPLLAEAGPLPPTVTGAQSLPDIIQPLLGAVVNISVLKSPGSGPSDEASQATVGRSLGSGFVISADGYIVTNKHVVDRAYNITVAFANGTTSLAEIVATNQRPDLALLKVKADLPLQFVKFGDSDALRVGESVIAIGNPLGLSNSVSVGIVSALNRDVNLTMIDDFVQTDAAINHGNSGGPLFNLKGEVIGVNYAIYSPGQGGSSGLGFAIPSNDAAWVITQMRQYGYLRAGFVGVRLQQVMPDIQLAFGLPSRAGGIVTGVVKDTPAEAAGIEAGDVILSLNGREPRDVRALLRELGASAPGSKITLQVWHEGKSRPVVLTVASWPDNLYNPAGSQIAMHHEMRPLSPDLGLKLAIADAHVPRSIVTKGTPAVAITSVAAGSPAADIQLAPGNLILKAGFDAVGTPEQVRAKIAEARAAERNSIPMLIEAGDDVHWIVMPLVPN